MGEGKVLEECYGGGFDAESVFEVGSIRKTFNSALIGRLVGQGVVDLQRKVAPIWPEIVEMTGDEKDHGITLHQLLSSTSGWLTPQRPGEAYLYNNAAFTVAEKVVGRILKLANDEIAPEVITSFKIPLNTGWRVYHFPHPFKTADLTEAGPKLAVDSNLRDLVTWGELWLANGMCRGRELIPGDYIQRATSLVNRGLPGAYYGYNWFINAGRALWQHAPEDSYGHSGWGCFRPSNNECRAYLWICPSLSAVAAVALSASTAFANDAVEVPNRLTGEWIGEVARLLS